MNLTSYDLELKRKYFHCASIIFPLTYLFTDKLTMVIILMISTGVAVSVDISRHYNKQIQGIVDRFFTSIMRREEASGSFRLSGVSYMFLGLFVSCVLFSKGVAISSFLVLVISDTVAALVGKQIGKPLENGKSLEGSIAFFVSAIIISMLAYTFEHYNARFMTVILACIATTAVEFYSDRIKINDNLAIPVVYGLCMSLLGFFV